MKINLHIDRVVLDGVWYSPDERLSLKVAIEAELSNRLANGGLSDALQSSGALSNVRTTGVQLTNDGNSERMGEQVALAVYEGIGR
jgi:hypothetical protein